MGYMKLTKSLRSVLGGFSFKGVCRLTWVCRAFWISELQRESVGFVLVVCVSASCPRGEEAGGLGVDATRLRKGVQSRGRRRGPHETDFPPGRAWLCFGFDSAELADSSRGGEKPAASSSRPRVLVV